MTKREIRRLVDHYVPILGLQAWSIALEFDVEPVDGEAATVAWSFQYDSAHLKFCKGWRRWDEMKARTTIVHELIHLVERDLQVAVKDQADFLGEGWEQFYLRWEHEIEGLTERLALAVIGAELA